MLKQHVTQHEAYSLSHVTTEYLRPAHQLQAPALTGNSTTARAPRWQRVDANFANLNHPGLKKIPCSHEPWTAFHPTLADGPYLTRTGPIFSHAARGAGCVLAP